jgi:antitoxin (DNA-binding transcriptional repressor) of toxin-antitoxin stability system
MRQVSRDEAQAHLAELLDAALDGEEVYIEGAGTVLVRLVPVSGTAPRRRAGTARGMIHMSDDFDDPLPELEEYMR